MENIQQYNKAIVVLIVGAVVLVSSRFGLNLDSSVQIALTTVVTSFVVWLVPNKKA